MTDARLELKTVAMLKEITLSVLLWDGVPFAVAGECAPPILRNGVYFCRRDRYQHGGYETFEIVVEGHSRVLFHKGNKGSDSKACVLVAENFTVLDGETAIGDSKGGFAEFMEKTKDLQGFAMHVTGRV